jgi:hypothetical protein
MDVGPQVGTVKWTRSSSQVRGGWSFTVTASASYDVFVEGDGCLPLGDGVPFTVTTDARGRARAPFSHAVTGSDTSFDLFLRNQANHAEFAISLQVSLP